MQIILSPTKLMSFNAAPDKGSTTKPLFPKKTRELVTHCQQLSVEEIAATMKINATMARTVYEQYQTFYFSSTPERAAALAYNGIAYKGLHAEEFTQEEYSFAQQHLNILSALYGILRPSDAIRPHRLEMLQALAPRGHSTLYQFWQDELNHLLAGKLKREKEKRIINVTSGEYARVIRRESMPRGTRMIDIRFLQQENNDLKQIVVHTKKARGMVARFIISHALTHADDLKGFDSEGYFYYPPLSKENEWVFVR